MSIFSKDGQSKIPLIASRVEIKLYDMSILLKLLSGTKFLITHI